MSFLQELATKYKTDKHGLHFYTHIYEKYMQSKKNENINLLEIGIGGLQDSQKGGESLRMWNDYFVSGNIYGLDIFKKDLMISDKVKIYQGSQSSKKDLMKIINDAKQFDFIVDDGSHVCSDQINSFKILFPYLKDGGYYFVEDIQTSYILSDGGDAFNLNNPKTAINYFKSMIDKINFVEFENPYAKQDYYCKNITEIHFYHNLIVIKKDQNNEQSNLLTNNKKIVHGKNFLKVRKIVKDTKYFLHYLRSLFCNFLDKLKF